MTDDRLFTRPSTLTPDERKRARLAFEQTPGLLDDAMRAALGHCERHLELMQQVLGRIRCSAS